MRSVSFLLLILIASSLALTQGSAAVPPSRMVMLHVRVTDSSGRALVDVPQSSLVVIEDGVAQKIAVFAKDEAPLSYGLMIDSSGSVREQYEPLIRVAEKIIESNRPGDETFLIRFVSSDKIYSEETTSDKAQLLKALGEFYVEAGQSAVIDAVYLATDKLAKQKMDPASERRRVLILMTDGEDRASYYKPEVLFNLLASTDVQMFVIGLTRDLKPEKRYIAVNLLTRLGVATGGQTFFASSSEEIERIGHEIMREIRTQYVIGYVPSGIDANKDLHKIQVAITDNTNQDKRASITRVAYSTQN